MKLRLANTSRTALILFLLLSTVSPLGAIDLSQFKDPDDGQLDLSNFLLEKGSG